MAAAVVARVPGGFAGNGAVVADDIAYERER